MEAIGEVLAVGPGLMGKNTEGIVAYTGNPLGAYTEVQILPAEKVMRVPTSIDLVTATSIVLKGLTCQLLLRQCFKVKPGHTGVGSLFWRWANALDATVIGIVSTKEKSTQAWEDG